MTKFTIPLQEAMVNSVLLLYVFLQRLKTIIPLVLQLRNKGPCDLESFRIQSHVRLPSPLPEMHNICIHENLKLLAGSLS